MAAVKRGISSLYTFRRDVLETIVMCTFYISRRFSYTALLTWKNEATAKSGVEINRAEHARSNVDSEQNR